MLQPLHSHAELPCAMSVEWQDLHSASLLVIFHDGRRTAAARWRRGTESRTSGPASWWRHVWLYQHPFSRKSRCARPHCHRRPHFLIRWRYRRLASLWTIRNGCVQCTDNIDCQNPQSGIFVPQRLKVWNVKLLLRNDSLPVYVTCSFSV